jgi:hypothetical protein
MILIVIVIIIICITVCIHYNNWPPNRWNWSCVSKHNSLQWSNYFNAKLYPGAYTCDIFDQHENGYCGICFLISPLQIIHEKLKINNKVKKETYLDIQHIANQYASYIRSMPGIIRSPLRSICFGGNPFDIVELLKSKRIGLKFKNKLENLNEHPRDDLQDYDVDMYVNINKVIKLEGSNEDIKWYILRNGPILAKISSNVLLKDVKNTNTEYDHIICVVGWENKKWILRNSWGKSGYTRKRPDNPSKYVLQDTPLVPWKGNDGYIKLSTNSIKEFFDIVLNL